MRKQRIRSRFKLAFLRLKSLWHSPQGKEVFTFLGFVVMAASIWFILAINDNQERTVQIPVELSGTPKEAVLLQDMPSHIEARIRDKGPIILGYSINGVSPIRIDFTNHDNGKDAIVINENTLLKYARKELKATTSILDIAPDSLRIGYTRESGKRVPVIISGTIIPSPHSAFSDSTYTTPDSVTVYSKASILKEIKAVYTEDFVLENIDDTTRINVKIKGIQGARIIPDSTTVVAPIEEYTTKTISVPVAIGDIPSGYNIMTFPSHINVTCLVPISKYNTITGEEFLVGNSFEAIQSTPGSFGPIFIINAPQYARNIMLAQDSIEYIINETSSTTPAQVSQ